MTPLCRPLSFSQPVDAAPRSSPLLTSGLGITHLQRGSLSHSITGIKKKKKDHCLPFCFPQINQIPCLHTCFAHHPIRITPAPQAAKAIELLKSAQGPHTSTDLVIPAHHAVHTTDTPLPYRKSLFHVPPTMTRTPSKNQNLYVLPFLLGFLGHRACSRNPHGL